MRFAIFLPVYNVENSVIKVLARIPASLMDKATAIICVDNGSQDSSVQKILDFAKSHPHSDQFTVLKNKENYLLGGSTIVAIREALRLNCDYLVNLHSDGQADAEDLAEILKQCDEN